MTPPHHLVPHLVSVPAAPLATPQTADRWGQVTLRVPRGADLSIMDAWRGRVAVRRIQIHAQDAPAPGALAARVGTGLRVDVRAGRLSPALAPVDTRALCRQGVTPWVVAEDAHLEVTRQAGAAGWPVLLEPDPALLRGEAPLLDLLDHYLFQPDLVVPVEPFHSLLAGALGRRSGILWRVWFGDPLQFFYVAEGGRVSLWRASPDADAPPPYGGSDAPPSRWQQSAGYQTLRALLGGRTPAPCRACAAEELCGGALLTLDPSARCSLWREVFERIRLAAATLDSARTSPEGASSR